MPRKIFTKKGDRFGKMTAVERGDDYVYPTGKKVERWWWRCDCGRKVLWIPAQVRYNARKGWGACPACKPAGWEPPRSQGVKTQPQKNAMSDYAKRRAATAAGLRETRDLVNPIRKALNEIPGVHVMRNAVGLVVPWTQRFNKSTGPFQAGLGTGSADIVGVVKVGKLGRFFALECKLPGQRITKEQTAWLRKMRRLGAHTAVVRSVEQALAAVKRAGGEPR